MLKHEDNPQLSPQPAAKVRVTPEELAAAVTALQIRKEGQPGTIAIGDAVEELGLNVTPEEVLTEVQARRQVKAQQGRSRALDRAIVMLGIFGILLGVAVDGANFRNWYSNTSARHLAMDQNHLQVGDATGKQVFLSEIGNGQIFRSRFTGASFTPMDFVPNDTYDDTYPAWTLIKYSGKVYIRGWIPRASNEVLQANGAWVINFQSPSNPVPVTLPVEGFKVAKVAPDAGSSTEDEVFQAQDVHLDSHAYEKW